MFGLIPWRSGKNSGALAEPFTRFRDEFDALFDRFFGRGFLTEPWTKERFWDFNVEDKESEIVVRAEAPGFEAADFDVQVSGNVLTLRAEHKTETKEEEGETHTACECRFFRSVILPGAVEAEKVDAKYRNGVLELRLPKTAEAKAKRIAVK
jgi:HSP20 family protein